MIITGLLLFFALLYLFVFLGVTIFKFKLRRMQRRAEEHANEDRTNYADGQIIYQRDNKKRKWFSKTAGEYVDYEEVK